MGSFLHRRRTRNCAASSSIEPTPIAIWNGWCSSALFMRIRIAIECARSIAPSEIGRRDQQKARSSPCTNTVE